MLLVPMLTACATFESGELPGLEDWPPPPTSIARSLAVEFAGLPPKFDAGWQRVFVGVLEDSQLFTSVTRAGAGEAVDRRLRFEFAHSRPDIRWTRTFMYLCALTAGILPARAANQFDVRATVLDRAGEELGVIERSVTSATWVGWVFLLAAPFAGVGMTGLAEDTARSILVEAAAAGWL
ncbi:MAG: hypothetical protein NXI31_00705 [bacterium]|nr:hypothetical protein [bacterium]